MVAQPTALADWRRQVGALYAAVRAGDDPVAAHWRWRETRDRLFGRHSQSPLDARARRTFAGLPYYDYDPAARFLVDLVPNGAAALQYWDIGADGALTVKPFARTRGLAPALGAELTVYWIMGYGGGLFLPFVDATAPAETYGGGRYVVDAIKGADLGDWDGRLIIDFNFAYNPSCAYSAAWTCPLAPPENRLPAAIRAGERTPAGAIVAAV